jgi:erythromycin esterase
MKHTTKTLIAITTAGLAASAVCGPAASAASAALADAGAGKGDPVVRGLNNSAHPLRSTTPKGSLQDLRPFGKMVGGAQVVGIGEATHSTSEFYTLNNRILRYLAEEKGFTTFGRELSWSTGLRLNEYVLHGKGNPRAIMHNEFRGPYALFDNQEFLSLLKWMRAYNTTHARKVQFMGDDLLYPGDILFDKVLAYVKRDRPKQLPTFAKLYKGLRPGTPDAGVFMGKTLSLPPQVRQQNAARANQALKLLQRQGPGEHKMQYAWAVQHARALSQTFTDYAFDQTKPGEAEKAQTYRDKAMADNVLWWNRVTRNKVQLSALDPHISRTAIDPAFVPHPQGAFLRAALGSRYVNVGTTFDRGGYNFEANATDHKCPEHVPAAERPGTCKGTVPAAGKGYNEYVLDQARFRDFFVDTRTAPPAVRTWLAGVRSTRVIGGGFWSPGQDLKVSLGASYDIVIHLHQVKAAKLLP